MEALLLQTLGPGRGGSWDVLEKGELAHEFLGKEAEGKLHTSDFISNKPSLLLED